MATFGIQCYSGHLLGHTGCASQSYVRTYSDDENRPGGAILGSEDGDGAGGSDQVVGPRVLSSANCVVSFGNCLFALPKLDCTVIVIVAVVGRSRGYCVLVASVHISTCTPHDGVPNRMYWGRANWISSYMVFVYRI